MYNIKINGEYFKEYIYADKTNINRYNGNTALGMCIQEGDIVDIITTPTPEREETKRSVGNTIFVLYGIDKYKNTKIEIIPI